ncbi:hypothetical protein [Rhizobium rhizophilum]|uniref:DUF2784 domain-containing protein n=1 Tax=Rhizobium rhizophilum TaxID=1850373 RepID=A0ABY2QYZ4_9HYPH|nr:hypothetical protein [Rhizobium rhizophilum]THV16717.1 hypothetical protein E9677_01555 [Rhizobium rhizophilum]
MIEQTLVTYAPLIAHFGAIGLSFLLFLIIDLRTKPMSGWAKVVLNLALAYAVLVGFAFVTNAYLDWRVYAFDLNGDGMFTDDEATAEHVWLMREWISDAGRNLAPFFAVVIAPIIVLIAYVLTLIRRATTKIFKAATARRWSR